jgi:hypothetical protein
MPLAAEPITFISIAVSVAVVVFAVSAAWRGFSQVTIGSAGLSLAVDEAAEDIRRRVDDDLAKQAGGAVEDREFALLREYHAQGLAQSKVSFRVSLVFAGLGFLIILVAVLNAIAREEASTGEAASVVPLIAGAVNEAVAALFFVQSNRARETMERFFDRLRVDRNLRDARDLAARIPEAEVASRVQALLALNLADAAADEHSLGFIRERKLGAAEPDSQ